MSPSIGGQFRFPPRLALKLNIKSVYKSESTCTVERLKMVMFNNVPKLFLIMKKNIEHLPFFVFDDELVDEGQVDVDVVVGSHHKSRRQTGLAHAGIRVLLLMQTLEQNV